MPVLFLLLFGVFHMLLPQLLFTTITRWFRLPCTVVPARFVELVLLVFRQIVLEQLLGIVNDFLRPRMLRSRRHLLFGGLPEACVSGRRRHLRDVGGEIRCIQGRRLVRGVALHRPFRRQILMRWHQWVLGLGLVRDEVRLLFYRVFRPQLVRLLRFRVRLFGSLLELTRLRPRMILLRPRVVPVLLRMTLCSHRIALGVTRASVDCFSLILRSVVRTTLGDMLLLHRLLLGSVLTIRPLLVVVRKSWGLGRV